MCDNPSHNQMCAFRSVEIKEENLAQTSTPLKYTKHLPKPLDCACRSSKRLHLAPCLEVVYRVLCQRNVGTDNTSTLKLVLGKNNRISAHRNIKIAIVHKKQVSPE